MENNSSKLTIALILIILSTPIGAIYVLLNLKNLLDKLYLLLWIFGVWGLFQAIFLSTVVLPAINNLQLGITIPPYFKIALYLLGLFSVAQIMIGFFKGKIQNLLNSVKVIVLLNSVIIPIVLLLTLISFQMQLYKIGSL
jgi:hypothetical protein